MLNSSNCRLFLTSGTGFFLSVSFEMRFIRKKIQCSINSIQQEKRKIALKVFYMMISIFFCQCIKSRNLLETRVSINKGSRSIFVIFRICLVDHAGDGQLHLMKCQFSSNAFVSFSVLYIFVGL